MACVKGHKLVVPLDALTLSVAIARARPAAYPCSWCHRDTSAPAHESKALDNRARDARRCSRIAPEAAVGRRSTMADSTSSCSSRASTNDWMQDSVHASAAGYQNRAALYAEAIQSC